MTITQRDSNHIRMNVFTGKIAEILYMQLLGSNTKELVAKDKSKKVIQTLQEYKYVISNDVTIYLNEKNYFVISN